jgi:hypothetical protein
MLKLLAPLVSAVLLAGCASFPAETYGVGIGSTQSVQATTLIHHPELYSGKPVVVQGTIAEVCPTRGCWMKLREGERELLVTFKDGSFTMPLDCAGREARISGVFTYTRGDDSKLALVATGVALLPR